MPPSLAKIEAEALQLSAEERCGLQITFSPAFPATLMSKIAGPKKLSGDWLRLRQALSSYPWRMPLLALAAQSREDFPQCSSGARAG